MLPNNTTKEHLETHLWMPSRWRAPLLHEQVPDGCDCLDWQGAAANGRACLQRAQGVEWIDTSLAVAIRSDERWNVFGDYSRVFAVGDCNCGCVETPVKKSDDWAIPPIPKVEREDSVILPQEQLMSSAQASFEFTCTSFGEGDALGLHLRNCVQDA